MASRLYAPFLCQLPSGGASKPGQDRSRAWPRLNANALCPLPGACDSRRGIKVLGVETEMTRNVTCSNEFQNFRRVENAGQRACRKQLTNAQRWFRPGRQRKRINEQDQCKTKLDRRER